MCSILSSEEEFLATELRRYKHFHQSITEEATSRVLKEKQTICSSYLFLHHRQSFAAKVTAVYLFVLLSVKHIKEESLLPRNNNFRGLIWSNVFFGGGGGGGDVVRARARAPVVPCN
jgi:hypothetical protein